MRVLFLDIDGVLIHYGTMGVVAPSGFNAFDPHCVSQLNRIIQVSACAVILSSTWRNFGLMRCREHFVQQGVRGAFRGLTPGPNIEGTERFYAQRGDEIQVWLDNHETERFCILDDNADMGTLKNQLVQTDPSRGLTEQDADRVIKMLGSKGGVSRAGSL